MGSLAVVITHKRTKCAASVSRRRVRDRIRPFAQQRLDEALGLAIRPRRIGARAQMPHAEGVTSGAKYPRDVAAPVIRHDAARANALRLKPVDRPAEKRLAAHGELIR